MSVPLRAAALALLLGLAACSGDDAERDDTGAVASQGAVEATALAVGDCVNDPEGADTEQGAEFTDIQAVPCDQPHDNEIYHQFDLPDGDYPGDDAVFESAGQACEEEFEAFVGTPYDESALDIAPITPTEGSWASGDRSVSCAIYDEAQVTGTLKGAAR